MQMIRKNCIAEHFLFSHWSYIQGIKANEATIFIYLFWLQYSKIKYWKNKQQWKANIYKLNIFYHYLNLYDIRDLISYFQISGPWLQGHLSYVIKFDLWKQ